MYTVVYYLNGERIREDCGSGKEAGAFAWRLLIAYLPNRAWLEYYAK
jgi:hypothetical protein